MSEGIDKKSDYKKIFKTMEQNIRNFAEQIDAPLPEPRTVESFDSPSYWAEVTQVCDKLSFEANKLSLCWLSPPVPSSRDLLQMAACLELACVALLASYHNLPTDAGASIRDLFRERLDKVCAACLGFIKTLANTLGKKFPSNTHPILQNFGDVSNSCDLVKNMPRSNRLLVAERLNDELGLLKDALSELEEVNNEDFMDDFDEEAEQYTEKDSQLLNPSKGLIKTSIVLIKKTVTAIKKCDEDSNATSLQQFDQILKIYSKMSSVVDDLALTLYPPIDWSECKKTNETLKNYLEDCLSKVSDFQFMTSEDAVKWRDFVGKAILHNFSEIQRVFISNGLAEMKIK